jgi:hypothetical protein
MRPVWNVRRRAVVVGFHFDFASDRCGIDQGSVSKSQTTGLYFDSGAVCRTRGLDNLLQQLLPNPLKRQFNVAHQAEHFRHRFARPLIRRSKSFDDAPASKLRNPRGSRSERSERVDEVLLGVVSA